MIWHLPLELIITLTIGRNISLNVGKEKGLSVGERERKTIRFIRNLIERIGFINNSFTGVIKD